VTISNEAIEAAARAWAIHDETDGCFERVDEWEALEDWEREAYPDEYPGSDYEDCGDYRERAIAALTSAAPHIQAAALRDAAESFQGVMIGIGGRDPRTSGAAWLHARADQLEGKS
jgi:hypothetical protein